jgi:hypothetical protein
MARKRKTLNPGNTKATADTVTSLKYPAKRRHIPPAGLEAQGRIAEFTRMRYDYKSQSPPVLRFSNEPAKVDQPIAVVVGSTAFSLSLRNISCLFLTSLAKRSSFSISS